MGIAELFLLAASTSVTTPVDPGGAPPSGMRGNTHPLCWVDEDSLPEGLQALRERIDCSVVQLTVHRWYREGGQRRFETRDVVGVLVDPEFGDVVTFGDALEGAERVVCRFVGAECLAPRRTRVLGHDESTGLSVVRVGPVELAPLFIQSSDPPSGHCLLTSVCTQTAATRATVGTVHGEIEGCRMGSRCFPHLFELTVEPCENLGEGGLLVSEDGVAVGLVLPPRDDGEDEAAERVGEDAVADADGGVAGQGASEGPGGSARTAGAGVTRVLPMAAVQRALLSIREADRARPSQEPSRAPRPWIGIACETIEDPVVLHHLGIDGGVVVEDIYHDSPAQRAGLAHHHVLVAWDGAAISCMIDLGRALYHSKPGDRVVLDVIQRGELRQIDLTLGSW